MEVAEDLLIGDFPCDCTTILDLMRQSESYKSLDPKWRDLSRALNIGAAYIKRLERSLRFELTTLNDVMIEMLEIWRAAVGNKATLKLFCEALHRSDLGDIADVLLRNFEKPMADPSTEKSCIPSLPKYYISRTLSLRTKLRPEIFQTNASDVFIFSGLERHELTLLANGKPTDISRNQRKRVTVRFILLELYEDIKDIFKVSSSPTHWVEKKNSCYYWQSSCGSLELIQQFISQNEETRFTEAEFVDKVFGEFNSTPICIADTPGMGKSLLLSSLAHQTKARYPDRHVAFLVLPDVIQDSYANPEKFLQDGLKWIHSTFTCIHGETCQMKVELFLDGYDEILADQLDHAKIFFNTLKKLSNLRFVVTTRPHLKNELEATLGVLSNFILPFDLHNQKEFLRQFWISNYNAHDCRELKRFTSELLTKLEDKKMKMEDKRDIAGVPLLCLMLAEVYSDDAVRCSNIGKRQRVEIEVSSIFSVFDMLMQKRLHQNPRLVNYISESLKENIINNHVYEAFRVIFPQHESIVSKTKTVSDTQMYAVGLLEFNGITSTAHFVHRNFAEFLVAEFLVKNMNHSDECADFLFKVALGTRNEPKEERPSNSSSVVLITYAFDYPVISYFINGQSEKIRHSFDFTKIRKFFKTQNRFSYKLLTASIVNNLPHCFDLAINTQTTIPDNEQMRNLFGLGAYHRSGNTMLNQLLQLVTKCEDRTTTLKNIFDAPLLIAANKGYYMCVEMFVNLLTIRNENIKCNTLLHTCLFQSAEDTDEIIEEKATIVKFICIVDRETLEERNEMGVTPLLETGAHPKLLMCLLELGANPNIVNPSGDTVLHAVLHYVSERFTPQWYTQVYDVALEHGFTLFNQRDEKGRTPLHYAVKMLEVEDRVLDSFQSKGADFNARDKDGNSVIIYAIKGGRSPRFIDRLINRHGCTLDKNDYKESALHHAARHGNLKTVRYLVDTKKWNINDKDSNGKTPLHIALKEASKNWKEIAALLVAAGAELIFVDSPVQIPQQTGPERFVKGEEYRGFN